MPKPFSNDGFHKPVNTYFDSRLISGSAVFGVGWALGGFCIGPAVTALPIAATENIVFLLMIMIGIVRVKYSGLWCDRRAWGLVGKNSKNSL